MKKRKGNENAHFIYPNVLFTHNYIFNYKNFIIDI